MKSLRKTISILLLAPVLCVSAQGLYVLPDSTAPIVSKIQASGNVVVIQPDALNRLLMPVVTEASGSVSDAETRQQSAASRTGFRIQVFDDNNPRTAAAQAKQREQQVRTAFPHLRAYVSFNSPYWRVKVGDFRTRGEAEAAMEEIREVFPQYGAYLRIVPDKINISD